MLNCKDKFYRYRHRNYSERCNVAAMIPMSINRSFSLSIFADNCTRSAEKNSRDAESLDAAPLQLCSCCLLIQAVK